MLTKKVVVTIFNIRWISLQDEEYYQRQKDTWNVYVLSNKASKYVKEKLTKLKEERDKSTNIICNFNTLISVINSSTIWKISNDTEDMNKTMNHFNLIDFNRTQRSAPTEHTFFSSTHGTLTKIDHILGTKSKTVLKYSHFTQCAFWSEHK